MEAQLMKRREFLQTMATSLLAPAAVAASADPLPAPIRGVGGTEGRGPVTMMHDLPTTGLTGPEFRAYDDLILERMTANGVPGGALAVTRHGRLVYARGYGYADVEAKTPVEPTSMFR